MTRGGAQDPPPFDPFPVERSERLYDSPWCGLRRDFLHLGAGRVQEHHVFEVPEAVCIVPSLDDGSIVLVWQYRHPLGRSQWEVPAGRMHAGEAPRAAAERELAEETGYRAGSLERVAGFHPINGISPHFAHVFLARGCVRAGSPRHDATERMSVHVLAAEEVRSKCLAGEIRDGFAIVGLFHHFARG